MPESSSGASNERGLTVEGLDHISITVSDVDASRKWYRETLGLESLQTDPETFVPYISNGKVNIALQPVRDGAKFTPPAHQGSRATHAAFRVSGPTFGAYKERLSEIGIEYEELNHEYALSIYFSDPDGYVLELTTYDIKAVYP